MIRAAFNTIEVRGRLLAMSERARGNAYKRAIRKAAAPVVAELKSAWASARRRRGSVTGEIAAAQRYSVNIRTRGKNAGMAVMKIGTDYRRGGKAKVWHIIENGFRHYGGHSVYASGGAAVREAKAHRAKFFADAVGDTRTLRRTKAGRDEIKQRYRAIRREWVSRHGDKEAMLNADWRRKTSNLSDARGRGARTAVAGRRVSRKVVESVVGDIAAQVTEYLAADVMQAAKGRAS